MPIDSDDWTITRATKVIAYIGDDHGGASPSYATVIQFHRWLQSLADDAVAVGDDELDITNVDPSRRSTDNIITLINGYTIGDTEAEHLYDGSIIYDDGDEVYDGIVNFGNADVQIQIIQDGAVLSDDWWNQSGAGLNPDANAGISHRFMIKTRTLGADIDGRRLLGLARRFGYTYQEFPINGTSPGNNVLALADALDLNNETAIGTVSGWTTIANVKEGFSQLDVDNNGTPENYYSEWNRAAYTINQFYERIKWLTRDGSTEQVYGLDGELFRGITHQVAITQLSGTFVEPEQITWGSGATAGVGQLLAINSTTAGTILWMQLLSGVIPSANTITGAGGATATAGAVTPRTVYKPVCGQSTGTAIIGAYGFGIEVADLTAADKVTDLGSNTVFPPNYVQNKVTGLVSGEDRVLVGPWDNASYDVNGDPAFTKDQLSLSGALSAADVGSIVVQEAIPGDTPNSGVIRVTDDNGFERRIPYDSWTGSTFSVDTGDPELGSNNDFNVVGASDGADVWIAYIDKEATSTEASFTSVQSGTRNLVALVRDGGGTPIKQFISKWSQGSSPSELAAIRTTDA